MVVVSCGGGQKSAVLLQNFNEKKKELHVRASSKKPVEERAKMWVPSSY